jgi:hypothetical protein
MKNKQPEGIAENKWGQSKTLTPFILSIPWTPPLNAPCDSDIPPFHGHKKGQHPKSCPDFTGKA